MKKITALILMMAICFTLVACNKDNNTDDAGKTSIKIVEKDKYDLIVVGGETKCRFSGVEKKTGIKQETVDETDVPIPAEYTVNGKVCKNLEYRWTEDEGLYPGPIRMYAIHEGFVYYSQNGDWVGDIITVWDRIEEGEEKSKEECRGIAEKLFLTLVDNPQDYTLYNEDRVDPNWTESLYYFQWSRMNGNLPTMERITVEVNVYGSVDGFSRFYLGDMKDIPTVPDAVVSKVLKTVIADIDAKYETVKENFTIKKINEEEVDIRVIRLSDGTVALDVTIDVLVSKNGTTENATEVHEYYVPIE